MGPGWRGYWQLPGVDGVEGMPPQSVALRLSCGNVNRFHM